MRWFLLPSWLHPSLEFRQINYQVIIDTETAQRMTRIRVMRRTSARAPGTTETLCAYWVHARRRRASAILAVCIYHAVDHLWTIPLLIKRLNHNYRFWMRNYCSFTSETVVYASTI